LEVEEDRARIHPHYESKEFFWQEKIYNFNVRLWANLARKGVTVGSHNLKIGATCISLGFSVVTLDIRNFGNIPE
jgi:predicted nucleic acid-binding protein